MSNNDEREQAIQGCRDILARLEALDPEARAELDRLLKESGDLEFLTEVISRVKDGSMSDPEAERWLDAAVQELGQRKAKN